MMTQQLDYTNSSINYSTLLQTYSLYTLLQLVYLHLQDLQIAKGNYLMNHSLTLLSSNILSLIILLLKIIFIFLISYLLSILIRRLLNILSIIHKSCCSNLLFLLLNYNHLSMKTIHKSSSNYSSSLNNHNILNILNYKIIYF